MRIKNVFVGFHPSFSRHGITRASSVLLIWLNENVLLYYAFFTNANIINNAYRQMGNIKTELMESRQQSFFIIFIKQSMIQTIVLTTQITMKSLSSPSVKQAISGSPRNTALFAHEDARSGVPSCCEALRDRRRNQAGCQPQCMPSGTKGSAVEQPSDRYIL